MEQRTPFPLNDTFNSWHNKTEESRGHGDIHKLKMSIYI